jgi:hypothetical protein
MDYTIGNFIDDVYEGNWTVPEEVFLCVFSFILLVLVLPAYDVTIFRICEIF